MVLEEEQALNEVLSSRAFSSRSAAPRWPPHGRLFFFLSSKVRRQSQSKGRAAGERLLLDRLPPSDGTGQGIHRQGGSGEARMRAGRGEHETEVKGRVC